MPILPPPPPSRSVFPTEISRSMHTVTIRFRKNYFSDENGEPLFVLVDQSNPIHGQSSPRVNTSFAESEFLRF
jgi:hypothetical protein